jgi:hypothetical protein
VGPGSIIRNTAEELHIVTGRLQTGSAGRRAVTLSLIAKIRLGNKSGGRAATWVAIEVVPESATELEPEQAIGLAAAMALGLTDLVAVEVTVLAAVTFPAVEEETAMLSGAARRATTGPARVPGAAADRRAWEAEAVAVVAAEVEEEVGAAVADVVDKRPLVRQAKPTGAGNELVIWKCNVL